MIDHIFSSCGRAPTERQGSTTQQPLARAGWAVPKWPEKSPSFWKALGATFSRSLVAPCRSRILNCCSTRHVDLHRIDVYMWIYVDICICVWKSVCSIRLYAYYIVAYLLASICVWKFVFAHGYESFLELTGYEWFQDMEIMNNHSHIHVYVYMFHMPFAHSCKRVFASAVMCTRVHSGGWLCRPKMVPEIWTPSAFEFRVAGQGCLYSVGIFLGFARLHLIINQ